MCDLYQEVLLTCARKMDTREQIHRVDLAERERRTTELPHQLHRRQLDIAGFGSRARELLGGTTPPSIGLRSP
jgi:hypothetical protein